MSIIIRLKRVELQAEVNVQAADGQPVDGGFAVIQPLAAMNMSAETKPMTVDRWTGPRSRCAPMESDALLQRGWNWSAR